MNSRILVWGLSNNRAGTEAVIYSYASYVAKNSAISFDFLCYEEPLNYSDLFSDEMDNRYFVIPVKIKHPFSYMLQLKKFMKKHKDEYSAIWCNLNDVSNIDILALAKCYGIKRRITHIHNSNIPDVLVTKVFSKLNWKRCIELTTDRWACSESAGDFLYGSLPYFVVPNLVDSKKCKFSLEKRERIRKELRIEEAFVIGTVGRLAAQKNHQFLVRLLPKVLEKNQKAVLLLVGDGPLREDLIKLSKKLKVHDHIIFAGSQEDIQSYLSAFDVYAFPSIYEGLSLSILEAQFNGLPCVISEGVGEESIISNGSKVAKLSDSEVWSRLLLESSRISVSLLPKAEKYELSNIASIAKKMFEM